MNKYHIIIHIETEAEDLFIAMKKAQNMINNNISEEYNPFIESIMEE